MTGSGAKGKGGFERKARDVARRPRAYIGCMSNEPISDAIAWAAFEARDRAYDGRVIGAVTTTGIYCKPSCPARHPKREHVTFYRDGAEARALSSATE